MEQDRDPDRVSLEGLDPIEALKALLAVDPDAPPVGQSEEGNKVARQPDVDDEQERPP